MFASKAEIITVLGEKFFRNFYSLNIKIYAFFHNKTNRGKMKPYK